MKKLSIKIFVFFLMALYVLLFGTISVFANPYEKVYQDQDGDGYPEVPCTEFAWQCAHDRKGVDLPRWGHAVDWWTGAANSGYSRGSTPQADSIAVWSDSGVGHVAYVTSGSGNTFTVDEGGRTDLDHTSSHGVAYGYTMTNPVGALRPYSSNQILLGFIYLSNNERLITPTWISHSDNSDAGIDWKNPPTLSGEYKFWFKSTNTDNNYFINIYLDGTLKYDHVKTDGNGYVSYILDTRRVPSGQHTVKAVLTNTNGTHEASISFNSERLITPTWISHSDNSDAGIDWKSPPTISGEYKFWFKSTNTDNNYFINIYLDGTLKYDHVKTDGNGYVSYILDTRTISSGQHTVKAVLTNTNGTHEAIIFNSKIQTYIVTYNANGGTEVPSAQKKVHGTSLTLSSTKPTRTGYVFKNWNTKANGTGTTYESGSNYTKDTDVTLYAQWKTQTKTVTFNANGGTIKGDTKREIEYGKPYGELPVPSWNGHKFLGWFTTGNESVSASTVCTSDITLYAHWKLDPASCVHEYNETEFVAPTCDKDGTRTYTCKHCEDKKNEPIPATGEHKWGEWTVSSEATCVKNGSRKHKCLICGKEETDKILATGIHEYGSWKIVKEATISEEGFRARKCINCSVEERETIPVVSHEHKWSEWSVEREATCELPGLSIRICSGCSNKEEKDILATGHKWGDWTLVTPATDEKNGVEVRICENDPSHVESRSTDKKESTVKVGSIKIKADPSTTICAGKKVSLSATVSPKNAVQTVSWASSNQNYATVTSKGIVTTKKAGIGKTVTITAKAKDGSGKTPKIRIKIVKDGVTKINLKERPQDRPENR